MTVTCTYLINVSSLWTAFTLLCWYCRSALNSWMVCLKVFTLSFLLFFIVLQTYILHMILVALYLGNTWEFVAWRVKLSSKGNDSCFNKMLNKGDNWAVRLNRLLSNNSSSLMFCKLELFFIILKNKTKTYFQWWNFSFYISKQ